MRYIRDESNCHLETDTSLNLTARRTDNPGYWGGLSYQEIDGYLNIPLFDRQGTTRFAYWFMGSSFFASAYILDAWGNLLSTPPAEPNPMVYVGQYGYYTDATGYIYLRGRLYDPVNGRFINRDPIGFRGSGPNEYGYVGNEPVSMSDPTGYQGYPPNAAPNLPNEGFSVHGPDPRLQPPDCTKLSKACKPVWFTNNPKSNGKKLAVYCNPNAKCEDHYYVVPPSTNHVSHNTKGAQKVDCSGPCKDVCAKYGKSLSPPVFSVGATVCIHGTHGNFTRKIDDCGCGQLVENKPNPDNWMDWEANDTLSFKDGWRCVCPGACPKK